MRAPRRTPLVSLAMLLAALGACDGATPDRLVDPSGPALAAAGGDQHAASGGGWVDLTSANAGFMHTAFSATQHRNGKVTGTFRQVREAGGFVIDFQGEVTCVAVDPVNRRAWIGGIVKRNDSTHPAFLTPIHEVGDDVWFRVVDYGEGANAAQPDRSTVLGFAGAAGIPTTPAYCEAKPWPDDDARTFPLTSGNIQVRP